MKKTFTRLLSLVLAAAMGLSLCGVSAFAEETGASTEEIVSEVQQGEEAAKAEMSIEADVSADEETQEDKTQEDKTQEDETTVVFDGGDGTEANPYQVATAEQLDAVRNDLSAYYIQTADIDLTGYDNWEPIGTGDAPFSGVFDGNGYSIDNLTIIDIDSLEPGSSDYYYNVGLFGYANGNSLLKYVSLTDVNISFSYNRAEQYICYVGSVVGRSGSVENCIVSGAISIKVLGDTGSSAYTWYIGGICGMGNVLGSTNYADITVKSSYEGRYNDTLTVGGVVGYSGSGTINSINYGDIEVEATGYALTGGIAGEGYADTCVNYGDISSTVTKYIGYSNAYYNGNSGGIVGVSWNTIVNCINYGNVSATKTATRADCGAGGICGRIGYYTSGLLQNCYNLADSVISDGGIGRISANSGSNGNTSYTVSNYSLDTTLINGAIAAEEDTGLDTKNGESLTADKINTAIQSILEELGLEAADNRNDDNFFIIKRDSNTFGHNAKDFGFPALKDDEGNTVKDEDGNPVYDRTECESYSENTIGVIYPTSIDYHHKLIENMTWAERGELIDKMSTGTWGGSCLGLTISLALANMGRLDVTNSQFKHLAGFECNELCYSTLLAPAENLNLRDLINYYQLMQYTDLMPATKTLYNENCFVKLIDSIVGNEDTNKSAFWNSFYADVIEAADNDIPTILRFSWKDADGVIHGHAVLTCGYDDSDPDDMIVQLYDPNKTENYIYLFISRTTAKFTFKELEDGEYRVTSFYVSDDNWNQFLYCDMTTLQSIDVGLEESTESDISLMALSPDADEATSSIESADETSSTMIFEANAYQEFRMENSAGQYIMYDGESYSTDMDIYNFQILGEESQTIKFEIDKDDALTITDFADNCKFSAYIGEEYYTVIADGADAIYLSEENGIQIEGTNYSFSAALSVQETENLIYISGSCTQDCTINYTEDGIDATTAGEFSSVKVEVINIEGVTTQDIDGTFSAIELDNYGEVIDVDDSSSSDDSSSGSDDDDDNTGNGNDTGNTGSDGSESGDTGNTGDNGSESGDSGNTSNDDSPETGDSNITAPETANGAITITPADAEEGDTVTITVTPDEGYELSGLTVIDENGNELTLTDNGDGTYSFVMPAGEVTITASFAAVPQTEPDGSTSTTSPRTGDSANLWLWMTALLMSGSGLATIIAIRRKKRFTK